MSLLVPAEINNPIKNRYILEKNINVNPVIKGIIIFIKKTILFIFFFYTNLQIKPTENLLHLFLSVFEQNK